MCKLPILLVLSLTLSCTLTKSYFYKCNIWSNESHNYFLFSDWHTNNTLSSKQRYDLINWAKKLNASVVVEDGLCFLNNALADPLSYDHNKNYYPRSELFSYRKEMTPLIGLTSLCYYAGIPVENVEYRENSLPIPASLVVARHNKIVKEIENYNDSERLNNIYKRVLNKYSTFLESKKALFEYLSTPAKSLEEFIGSIFEFNDKVNTSQQIAHEIANIIKDFGFRNEYDTDTHRAHIALEEFFKVFDCPLLDLRLLHAIHNQKTKNIIVAGGGLHVEEMNTFFSELGYTKIYSTYEGDWDKYNKWFSKTDNTITLAPLVPSPIDIDIVLAKETKKLNVALGGWFTCLNPYLLLFKAKSLVDSCWLSSVLNHRALNKMITNTLLIGIGFGLSHYLSHKSLRAPRITFYTP